MTPDDDDPDDSADGPVLSPEDLEITEDDSVTEIDDGRFVISPGGSSPTPDEQEPSTDAPPEDAGQPPSALSEEAVHDWLDAKFSRSEATYGFDITAKFDNTVHQQTLLTNDVVTNFENLLRWYARHAGGDTPVDEALGILLSEADTQVRYPPAVLEAFIRTIGLERTDSIGDLIERLEETGFRFPP